MKKVKLVELPFATITAILQRAQIPAKANPGTDAPVSRPRLPPQLISNCYTRSRRPTLSGSPFGPRTLPRLLSGSAPWRPSCAPPQALSSATPLSGSSARRRRHEQKEEEDQGQGREVHRARL